ncbi:class I SAM-dependent DNA methyltransferase [Mycobacterium gastri]|nr:class I SAM-dependent methyltransferase [Mycobacterium gastri]
MRSGCVPADRGHAAPGGKASDAGLDPDLSDAAPSDRRHDTLMRVAPYSEIAKFYDAISIHRPVKAGFLQSLIEKYAPTAKTILEFASGTGMILEGLSQQYDISGVDLSPEMIAIAKQKLPDVDMRVGDIAKLDFGKTFDAVLCVYDSINHLPDWESWCATFANARKHLNQGGLFIFDMNSIEHLEGWTASNSPWGRVLGENYMITDVKKLDRVFNWEIKVFEKESDGRFRLYCDNIYEISFPLEQVRAEAEKNFRVIEIMGAEDLEGVNSIWRPLFICQAQ